MLEFFKSRGFLAATVVVFMLALVSGSFAVGAMVGYRKASFSYEWGQNYHLNFGGPRDGFMRGVQGDEFIGSHGLFGRVVAVNGDEITLSSRDAEQIIVVSDKTDIRQFREVVSRDQIRVGDTITVLGNPADGGKINAEFIRIVPALMPGPGMMQNPNGELR